MYTRRTTPSRSRAPRATSARRRAVPRSALDADVVDSAVLVLGHDEGRLPALELGDAAEHDALLLLDPRRAGDGCLQVALLENRLLDRALDPLGVEDLGRAVPARGQAKAGEDDGD